MDMGQLFALESHGPDAYVGCGPEYPWGGLYGGQIVAQALRAAARTLGAEFAAPDADVHSLRAYFIRGGDHLQPVRYEVDRTRNGRSFATRRVVARQNSAAILNLEASFQRPEPAANVQVVQMPAGLPGPGDLPETSWNAAFSRRWIPPEALGVDRSSLTRGRVAAWVKVNEPIGEDPLLHRCWLSYLSDDLPRDAVGLMLPWWDVADEHRWSRHFGVSLDHTVWFHRPALVDDWHYYDLLCHGYIAGRGLTIGHVFRRDGAHVATIAQELLMRGDTRRHATDHPGSGHHGSGHPGPGGTGSGPRRAA